MLIDTSAWVEFLRGTESDTCRAVEAALREDVDLTTCDPVVMEVLAGGRSDRHVEQLRGLLGRATHVHCVPLDYEQAAIVYRSARTRGLTVRKLVDCLIASVALRTDQPVLHADTDFDAIAKVTGLPVRRD